MVPVLDTTEDFIEEVKRLENENQALYDLLIDSGYSRNYTLQAIRVIENEKEDYLAAVSGISVIREVEIDVLNSSLKSVKKEFEKLPLTEKNELLWDLGFNTKDFNFYIFSKVVRVKSKPVVKLVLIGQERLDDTWINKRDDYGVPYASREARDVKRSHFREYSPSGGVLETIRRNKDGL